MIFGTLCFCAAIQAYFTYPETCGKTLEEIELLFSHGSMKPWKTKPGDSLLDARIADLRIHPKTGNDHFEAAAHHVEAEQTEEKTAVEG